MSRIGIVAALEREVAPLLRGWESQAAQRGGREYKFFQKAEAALVCGGIGQEAARRAAEVLILEFQPSHIVSVGFAGALDSTLQVADIFRPATVIDAGDGSKTAIENGHGILVSFNSVAGRIQKQKLRLAYGAAAVDMEAAAVARAAHAHGLGFGVLKAVSDDAAFEMPAMDRFVSADGGFHSMNFAAHVAVRPWLWPAAISLARNSAHASHVLSDALASYLSEYLPVQTVQHE